MWCELLLRNYDCWDIIIIVVIFIINIISQNYEQFLSLAYSLYATVFWKKPSLYNWEIEKKGWLSPIHLLTVFYSNDLEDIFSVKSFLFFLLQKGPNSILSKMSIGLVHECDACPNHKGSMCLEITIFPWREFVDVSQTCTSILEIASRVYQIYSISLFMPFMMISKSNWCSLTLNLL